MTSTSPAGMEPQKVELVLAQLDSLPSLAPVATRILALTEDSHSKSDDLVRLIETDPSLTARVLSLLGRADLGVRPEAVTVRNGVLMLGFDTIRHVTLALTVMDVVRVGEDEEGEKGLDRLEFWKHCLAVACAARRLAMVTSCDVSPEEAFVLGLLHDIGKVALDTAMPKSYARVVRECAATRKDISDVERSVLGVDHTVVGHRLAQRWGLPERMIESAWLHHQAPDALPASVASGRYVQVVQLADSIAREQRIGYSGNTLLAMTSHALAAGLGVPESEYTAIVASLAEEIESKAAWIGVEHMSSREVYLRALMQSAEDLSAANTALSKNNRQLNRTASYFAALGELNRSISPKASVRAVCAVGAETIRRALGVPSVLVFLTSENGRWVETGYSDGSLRSDIQECSVSVAERANDEAMAVQYALGGVWLSAPGHSFEGMMDRVRGELGDGPVWLLPLMREQQWVAGSLFSASSEIVADLRSDAAQIEALSSAVGLAIAQAQAQTSAMSLADELADVNRHISAMQDELVQTRALQTVAAMAAGAAHEMNNPLSIISVRAQLLRGQISDEKVREAIDTIVTQSHACSDIVADLMDFAQPRPAKPESILVRGLLDSIVATLVDDGLLAASDLVLELSSDMAEVWFDREQLGAVFRELICNAVDATKPGLRRLTVKALPDLTEEKLVLLVADNGCGMQMEVLARAVDPFYSHREAGRGRGLGLARVQRWLQQNGGTMRLDSEPGRGTRVELRLPTTDGLES